jgi:hypothetical protein
MPACYALSRSPGTPLSVKRSLHSSVAGCSISTSIGCIDDESRFNQGEAGLGQHQLVPRWPLYRGLVSLLLGNQSDSLLPGTAPESMRKWLERELAASARSYMETSEYHNHNHLLLRCHLVEPSLGSEF